MQNLCNITAKQLVFFRFEKIIQTPFAREYRQLNISFCPWIYDFFSLSVRLVICWQKKKPSLSTLLQDMSFLRNFSFYSFTSCSSSSLPPCHPPPLMRCGPWVGPIVAKQKPVIAECHCCLCSVFLKGISGPSQKALPGCRDCSNIYTSSCPQMPAAPPLLHSGSEPSTCCCHSFHLTWIRLLIPHDELQNVCKHHNIDSVPLFFFF